MNIAKPILALALGAPLLLAGCATRSSVEQAQASANAAGSHAAAADADAHAADSRAADARSAADQAAGIGNNAMTAAQTADEKATDAQTGLVKANQRIAYLEYKLLPHKKHHIRHRVRHTTPSDGGAAPTTKQQS